MLTRFVLRDLLRNPRRSLTALLGIVLGVGLFSSVLFFIDGSSASMTARAVAPLPIDMQRVQSDPLGGGLSLDQTLQRRPGGVVSVHLLLRNDTGQTATEVVVRSRPRRPDAYVGGSTRVDGRAVPDVRVGLPLARGRSGAGLNLGRVGPGRTADLRYRLRPSGSDPAVSSSFSTRQHVVPVPADAPEHRSAPALANELRALPAVASADALEFVDLRPGAVRAEGRSVRAGAKLFAFTSGYRSRFEAIRLVSGRQRPGAALLSAEAARTLGVHVGQRISVALPGGVAPVEVEVSGIADLSRARALFYSRQGDSLEEFRYVPSSVVIDPALFERRVLPAFREAAGGSVGTLRSRPTSEVDLQVERGRLDADPGAALRQSRAAAEEVMSVAGSQDYLVDNLSNTLAVAQEDAGVAKQMFGFLGLPGILLAAVLSAFAGSVLAAAQRREQAALRLRGANRRILVRAAGLRVLLLTVVGAGLGVGLGLAVSTAVLGASAMGRASVSGLVVSGAVGALGGLVTTAAALFASGAVTVRRDIHEARTRLGSSVPRWLSGWLSLGLLAALAGGTVVAARRGAFEGVPGSVYEGRGVHLDVPLLVLPLGVWIVGAAAFARLLAGGLVRVPLTPAGSMSARPVRGLVVRSMSRRAWSTAQTALVLALIVGLGVAVATFAGSYDRVKAADARYGLGSDVKVVPSPAADHPPDASFTERLGAAPGVEEATPVVYSLRNSLLRSELNEDVASLAAVRPTQFAAVAGVGASGEASGAHAADSLARLARTSHAVLLSEDMAEFLSAGRGDDLTVVFARGTPDQVVVPFRVAGTFQRLPGFPSGVDAVVDLATARRAVAGTRPDFYLASVKGGSGAALSDAVAALRRGPAQGPDLAVQTRGTTLDKDQSSLAALNVHGLLTIDAAFSGAMAAACVGIFVFGLLLQRRREYVTLRALGHRAATVRRVILAETAVVAVTASLAGLAVGVGMGSYFVRILRPLFVTPPVLTIPVGQTAALVALVLLAALLTSLAATAALARIDPTQLLRDE